MEIIISFVVGIAVSAVVALLVARYIVKTRVRQAEDAVRAEIEPGFKMEQARLESDLRHSNDRAEELSAELIAAREDADRQLSRAKEEAEKILSRVKAEDAAALVQAKAEAERLLGETKNDASKLLEDTKSDLQKRYEDDLSRRDATHKEAMAALQVKFDETIAKVTEQVKMETGEMLKARQKEFSESSNVSIGQLVNPLKENIESLKRVMESGNKEQAERNGEIKERIKNLMEHSDAARKSADELAAALRHGSKIQGDWGETVLEELLSVNGLTKGIHFDTQAVIMGADGKPVKNESGGTLRPDVILHLDERREVIIDSKVSLSSYVDYVNAENEADRQAFLKLHIESIKKHVKELAVKDYSGYVKSPKVSAGYVIMFVPIVGALWLALNSEPDLWRRAAESNVYIADEQSLYGALKIVSLTWTQVAQAQNHEKVYDLANEMIDRVGQFMERYEAMGKALEKAQSEYEGGLRKLSPQGQSIINTSKKLIGLGAKNSDKHPVIALQEVNE